MEARWFTLLLLNEVEDAEGLDKEHVGEDESTQRTIQLRHDRRDGNECREMRNTDSFYVEPMRGAHNWKNSEL